MQIEPEIIICMQSNYKRDKYKCTIFRVMETTMLVVQKPKRAYRYRHTSVPDDGPHVTAVQPASALVSVYARHLMRRVFLRPERVRRRRGAVLDEVSSDVGLVCFCAIYATVMNVIVEFKIDEVNILYGIPISQSRKTLFK